MDLRALDLAALNSLTKYPSIPTYHALDPRTGGLLDETVAFTGPVVLTEKVDGTNARIVQLPGGDWLIGSREELLHARGDLIHNPSQGIVDALRPVAEALPPAAALRVWFLELYGGKIGGAARQYTADPARFGWRLFDAFETATPALDRTPQQISAWRDAGGQPYLPEDALTALGADAGLTLTPRLATMDAADLPTSVDKTRALLGDLLPATRVALGGAPAGRSEGVVLRTPDRSVIAKARFADYDRTLKRRR
ncbi:RNA ligase family protein [Spirilliplanes yamanashiensis]|nr:RNA ligase family protein [Spirilliplanes yamanashiensis]MDP9815098.1 hypothetical protein [Spirilliplanes yamanashiensis]